MRKKTTKVFVIVTCANGVEIVAEHDAKNMEAKVRRWAAAFISHHANEVVN
jgi:hypothetical protein